jgi:hypothetical protein
MGHHPFYRQIRMGEYFHGLWSWQKKKTGLDFRKHYQVAIYSTSVFLVTLHTVFTYAILLSFCIKILQNNHEMNTSITSRLQDTSVISDQATLKQLQKSPMNISFTMFSFRGLCKASILTSGIDPLPPSSSLHMVQGNDTCSASLEISSGTSFETLSSIEFQFSPEIFFYTSFIEYSIESRNPVRLEETHFRELNELGYFNLSGTVLAERGNEVLSSTTISFSTTIQYVQVSNSARMRKVSGFD